MSIKKGSVNIFVHGVLQNRFFFEKTIQMIKDCSKNKDVIDIGVITFRKQISGNVSTETSFPKYSTRRELVNELILAMTNNEYQKLDVPVFFPTNEFLKLTDSMHNKSIKTKIKLLTDNGYNIAIRYEGSLMHDSSLNIKKELRKLVRTFVPCDMKYNLIGHSRGGLASLSYAMTYSEDVNKVITLGTPYAGNIFAKYLNDSPLVQAFVMRDKMAIKELAGESPFLKDLHVEWSRVGHKKVDLTAIGFDFGFGADGIVDIKSQLACYKEGSSEYKHVKRFLIRSNPLFCMHSNETTNTRVVNLLNELIRQPKIITLEKDSGDIRYKNLMERIADIGREKIYNTSKRMLRPKPISVIYKQDSVFGGS